MQKKTKRKLFVILMALTLIVTLMPTLALAEEGIEGEPTGGEVVPRETLKINVDMKGVNALGEPLEAIEKDAAKTAELKLEKLPMPEPQALDSDTHVKGASSILLKNVEYEDTKASVNFGEVSTSYRYRLTEETAPTGYLKSENEYVVCLVKDDTTGSFKITYLNDSGNLEDIPEEGLLFEHEKIVELKIKFSKTVKQGGNVAPDENEEFTAVLGNELAEGKVVPIYEKKFRKTTGTDNYLTFDVGVTSLSDGFLLQEKNDGNLGWDYDERIYTIQIGSPTAVSELEEGASGSNEDGYIVTIFLMNTDEAVEPTNVESADFENTYTKSYSGGGSTTRYYNVKVNNGKALSITGAELSRVVAGTTINAVADPAAEGKVFKGWEVVKGGITVGEADRFTFAMPHEDVEITAVYEDKAEPVTPADPGDSEDPAEPDDVDEQPEDYDGPVPKTGDAQAVELAIFAALMLMAAFGLKKVYNR